MPRPPFRLSCCLVVGMLLGACAESPVTAPADAASADAGNDGSGLDATPDSSQPDVPGDPPPPCRGRAGCPCVDHGECDDGNLCTYGQSCEEGKCTAGQAEACDDGNGCTADACDPASGCLHTFAAAACQDGDPCTVGDSCLDGACQPGKPKTCDDGNFCTDDACTPGIGCAFAHNAKECQAGSDCVEASFCAFGDCKQGKGKPCDDTQPCTYDTCDPTVGCQFFDLPAPATCTDGQVHAGRCWKALTGKATWRNARKACQAWGGELASVHNKYENAFARQVATSACGKDAPAWLGATDMAQEGAWRFSDATTPGYGAWGSGEPNNAGGSEDFAEMTGSGAWNDAGEGAELACALCVRPLLSACDDPKGCTSGAHCSGGACDLSAAVTVSCDDANPCTLDGCAVGLGCGHTPTDDGVPCATDGVCQAGTCVVAKPTLVPASCLQIHQTDATLPSGLYWLDPDGSGPISPFQALCDMAGDGGGWTLVLQVDGGSKDNGFDGAIWTGKTPIAADLPLDATETSRWPAFWTLPVSELRVGMRTLAKGAVAPTTRWLTLPVPGPSLQALFAAGKPVASKAGLVAWEGLLQPGSLQAHCHLEGLNAAGSVKIRVGILGNNENDCGTVDSWIGLGVSAGVCGAGGTPSVGNVACWNPDKGDAKAGAVGLLMVR